jgi:uncharacterized protein YdeI (YjbR/CyaY-like superfamily)
VTGNAEERLVEPLSRSQWRAWLAEHAEDRRGVWLVLHKGKQAPMTYTEAVEEALAAGWIDSKVKTIDAIRYRIWMAQRKPGSLWSPRNKERVARLEAAGLMTARGAGVVEAAKADGSWNALDPILAGEIPADLSEALAADRDAADFFAGLPESAKRITLYWISEAKTPETRQRRIREAVSLAGKSLRAPQPRQPDEH